MVTLLIIALVSSIVLYSIVGWLERRAATHPHGYFQAGRNIGSTELSGTYIATSLALANAIFYFLWLGHTAGLVGLWIQLAWCLGFFVLWYFLPKMLDESGKDTLHGYLGSRFGTTTALLAAIVSFLGIGMNFGYEVIVGSTLAFSAWPESIGAVAVVATVVTLLVIVYCTVGGFAAVIRTDTFQWILGSLALVVALIIIRSKIADAPGGLAAFHEANKSHFSFFSKTGILAIGGAVALLSNIAFSLPWQVCDVTSWQKVSACDPKYSGQLRTGVLLTGIYLFFIPGLITLLLGIYLRHFDPAGGSLLGALINVTKDSPLFTIFILFGFLAAMISTADTFLIGATQTLVIDLLKRRRVRDSGDNFLAVDASHVRLAKRSLAPVAAIFTLFAWLYWANHEYNSDGLFTIVYIVYSMQLSLTWVVVLSLVSKRSSFPPLAGLLSIGMGMSANIIAFYFFSVDAMPIACVLTSFVGFAIGYFANTKGLEQRNA